MNSYVVVSFKKIVLILGTSPLFYSILSKFSFIDANIYKIINIKKSYLSSNKLKGPASRWFDEVFA